MKQALKIIMLSALATAAVMKGIPALAEPASTAVTLVQTNDLNLATADGQRTLERRLFAAAHTVCDTASPADLKARNLERECRSSVLSSARLKARSITELKTADRIAIAVK